jgi:hypothetical protein
LAERPREEGHGGGGGEAIWIARRGTGRGETSCPGLGWCGVGGDGGLSGVEAAATCTGGSVTGGVGRELGPECSERKDLWGGRGRVGVAACAHRVEMPGWT